MKPKHYCHHAGCRKLIDYDKTYCDKHQSDKRKHVSVKELKASEPFYNLYHSTRWTRTSLLYRREHPICEQCLRDKDSNKDGQSTTIVRLGASVDHIVALKDGGDPYNWNNLQTLCALHHNRKTKLENERRNS